MITLLEKIHLLTDDAFEYSSFVYIRSGNKYEIFSEDNRWLIFKNHKLILEFIQPNVIKFINEKEFNRWLKFYFIKGRSVISLSLDEYYDLMQMNETEIILDLLQNE
jgi:hypothetical protein